MKIHNRTHYVTADLRRIISRVARTMDGRKIGMVWSWTRDGVAVMTARAMALPESIRLAIPDLDVPTLGAGAAYILGVHARPHHEIEAMIAKLDARGGR